MKPTASHRRAKPRSQHTLWTRSRERLGVYLRLTRLNRPIGTFLLLWPTLWALWLRSEERRVGKEWRAWGCAVASERKPARMKRASRAARHAKRSDVVIVNT